MKIKIVGFKVGKGRPTANKTIKDVENTDLDKVLMEVLEKSDFISIRRVE